MAKMNFLDHLVNYVSPGAGARRVVARQALDIYARYEGAKNKEGWRAVGSSANSEVGRDLVSLRNASRDLGRNSPFYARMLELFPALIVGDGITPAVVGADDELAKRLMDKWEEWAGTTACDASEQTNFYGLQTLAVRGMIESGEALIRKRWRRPEDNLPVPLQLQLLEADHFNDAKDGPVKGGGVDIQGVRFNAFGRIEGYHLFDYHPGDNTWASQRGSRLVPAADVIHLFAKQRAGQVRGVPRGHAILNLLRDMDDYRDARGMKAKIEATLALFISSEKEVSDDGAPGSAVGLAKTKTDPNERDMEYFDPGTVFYGRPGEEPHTISASSTGDGNALHRANAQEMSAGFGITYDQATGDLSQANYSSIRAGGIPQRRIISQNQKQTIIPIMCGPSWSWFCQAGELAGHWKGSQHKSRWVPPAHEKVDPKKDSEADVLEVVNGFASWSDKVQARGDDPKKKRVLLLEEVEWFRSNGLSHPMDKDVVYVSEEINESNSNSNTRSQT